MALVLDDTAGSVAQAYRERLELMVRENFFKTCPDAFLLRRRQAMEHFVRLGFPIARTEEWRHTRVEPLSRTIFPGPVEHPAHNFQVVAPFTLEHSYRITLSNGRFQPVLSSLTDLPKGVRVASLAQALAEYPAAVLDHLARYANDKDHAFVALNTALFHDGVFIHVPPGVTLTRPLHVIYLAQAGDEKFAVHPRTLIVAGENSQCTVMEQYIGVGPGPRHSHGEPQVFNNAVTEIVAGGGAVIDYLRLQQETDAGYHVGTVQTHQQAHSQVALHGISVSGELIRNEVNAVLAEPGAEVRMNGLYLVRGRQHVDNHTRIDHVAPRCTSLEHYKGILDGNGHGVFNGRIVVHPDAQQTSADQSNRNLMLSDQALVNTNPQLEIYADDVKCNHGATVGQIDDDAIFYFRSRGIDPDTARQLMVHGFTHELIDQIRNPAIREIVAALVDDWLAERTLALTG